MERVRSFIAIELPPEVRAELGSLEEKLKGGKHPFVKWVDPEGIHLTLKFLGGIPADMVPRVSEAMTGVAGAAARFSLRVGTVGVFPNWQRPQVVWVGVGGDVDRLAALHRSLEAALAKLGFAPESRSFKAHLTLGRLRERATPREKQDFGTWAQSVGYEGGPSFEVSALSLMKSQLTPAGAIYSRLASAPLAGLR